MSDTMIAKNRKAYHDFEIIEKFEAGIELTGTEVKSLRENNCQMTDGFVFIRRGEAWLNNLHISPFKNGNINNVDPDRKRRLLLHKKQIRYLSQQTREKGRTVIPLKMYFKEGKLVKLEIAIAKGRKLHDKREAIAKKTQMREAQEYLKRKNQ
ncbi:MAG: SsrA-binding protein SmpB [Coriobacteriia bacterium]|nr:SsrA-binding protein SmpB [Coriobacteriia bacterium]